MEKTRKIQSIIQDVIEGRKENNEATIDILALCDVSQQRELLIAWEQYKKANWYESDAIDVEKILMSQFLAIYSG